MRGSEGEAKGVGAAAGSVPPDPTMMGLYYSEMLLVSWPPLPLELIFTIDSLAKETYLACTVQQMLTLFRELDSLQVRSLTTCHFLYLCILGYADKRKMAKLTIMRCCEQRKHLQ